MFPYLRPTLWLGLAFTLLLPKLHAQRSQCVPDGQIQVHVTTEDSRPVDMQLRVDLTGSSGNTLTQQFTDSSGQVKFHVAQDGAYYAHVSGPGIEDAVSPSVEFYNLQNSCRGYQSVFVRVKLKPGAAQSTAQSNAKAPNAAITSAAELRVPQSARKSFEQGMTAWQKKDYQQAAEKFEKAVADYPQYDTAYNNLGVMYAHLNQTEKSVAAFKRSVELNDKNADADRNLARMLIRQKEYPQAEELLKKALVVQQPDASTLTMLAMAEIQDGKPDDAIRDAQKVHALSHDGYAVAHYIAAEALEEKHQNAQASAEYNLYLKESPNGPEAAQAKSALERLSSVSSAAGPSGGY